MNIGIGMMNLWIILALIVLAAGVIMFTAVKMRAEPILNAEDHQKKDILLNLTAVVSLLIVSIITPIVTGLLFWAGCFLIIIAGILYMLSIAAFVKSQKGIAISGIYRYSRNPMYVAMFLVFMAFVLMAWQAEPVMAVPSLLILILNLIAIHRRVTGEERYLKEKYGSVYTDYAKRTPRYFGPARKT